MTHAFPTRRSSELADQRAIATAARPGRDRVEDVYEILAATDRENLKHGLPPRLVQTLCVETAREIERSRHPRRHRILKRRFQHDAAIYDLHGDLQFVVQPHVTLAEPGPCLRAIGTASCRERVCQYV